MIFCSRVGGDLNMEIDKEFKARCSWHADGSSSTKWAAKIYRQGKNEVKNVKLHRRGEEMEEHRLQNPNQVRIS